jgi:hypothetical protein
MACCAGIDDERFECLSISFPFLCFALDNFNAARLTASAICLLAGLLGGNNQDVWMGESGGEAVSAATR